MMVYMLIADGDVDQIVETAEIARREKKDLERMGFEVKVKRFASWADAEAYEDKLKG